jgi:hypothetical protein
MAMEDMWRILHILQYENNNMRQAFEWFQVGAPPTPQSPGGAINQQILQLVPKSIREPRVSLLEKFDGTRSKFRSFVNQIWFIFRLQPWQYPTGASQVGIIEILLFGATLSWFVPLLEKHSPFLEDLDDFLMEFSDAFGETDRVQTATTKLGFLRQGSRPTLVYATDFHQLACDVNWNNNTLISTF